MSKSKPGRNVSAASDIESMIQALRLDNDESSGSVTPETQEINYKDFAAAQSSCGDIHITSLDHVIAKRGGSTANIERLPRQLKLNKDVSLPVKEKLLAKERQIGRLRVELNYLQDVRRVLMILYANTVEIHKRLLEDIQSATQGLAIAENNLLKDWGISIDKPVDTEKF